MERSAINNPAILVGQGTYTVDLTPATDLTIKTLAVACALGAAVITLATGFVYLLTLTTIKVSVCFVSMILSLFVCVMRRSNAYDVYPPRELVSDLKQAKG